MKTASVAFAVAVAFFCLGEPAFAQGRGIGRSVNQLARNGVRGTQLAARVHQLEAARGIDVEDIDLDLDMDKGGPPPGKGPGMAKAGPPLGKGPAMQGGKKNAPPAVKGPGGKIGPPAGKGKPF